MKSICIKTNNQNVIEYLLEQLNNMELDICFSLKSFKHYKNIIIHFKESNNSLFLNEISNILSYLVVDLYEEKLIDTFILSEYFYFDAFEREKIADITIEDLCDFEEADYSRDKVLEILSHSFYEYLNNNHSLFLDGFITFRLKEYSNILMEQIDKSVNKFLIQREYVEFISLLKMYINSEDSNIDLVHLIYCNSKPILLDENKNVIKVCEDIFNAKYLSDISFSSNDYALNTLLNLIPKKIYVHLIDNKIDEFINTLKLIFEDRISFCNDCSICRIYKNLLQKESKRFS